MAEVKLDATDAAELAGMLQFLTGWPDCDPGRLGESLGQSAGHPAYDVDKKAGRTSG